MRRSERDKINALLATQATVGLIEPMANMIGHLTDKLAAHHAGGAEGMALCPICQEWEPAFQALYSMWDQARSVAMEHVVYPDDHEPSA